MKILERQNPWWFNKPFKTGIKRTHNKLTSYLQTPEILLLTGARRTGKSTTLYQIIHSLIETTPPKQILFLNFDEPLLQSQSDPDFLHNLITEYQEKHNIKYVFIDEIQQYEYWSQTLKILHDTTNLKLIATGSSSTLVESVAATRLAGRYLQIRINPLSFKEFLQFKNQTDPSTTKKKLLLDEFIQYGGFPRVVLENNNNIKEDILKNYFQTMYLQDIIYPQNLRNNKDLFELLFFIMSNVGKELSYRSIASTLDISIDTIKEYIRYAEEAYVIKTLHKFDFSVKKQLKNPKKLYSIDTGLANAVSFKFSENEGRLFENLIFNNVENVYYDKNGYECDFVLKDGSKITSAIQVTTSLNGNRKRELKGLIQSLNKYNLKKGLIITKDQKDVLTIDNKEIHIIPAYEWLEAQPSQC